MKLLTVAAYGGAAAVIALVGVIFALAMPEAAERTRQGRWRAGEAACHDLQPAETTPLGALPVVAPDFKLPHSNGVQLSLSQLRGQVVLVNFWATWCRTCVVEMPSMERLARRMAKKPFRLLAVSVDDDWDAVWKFFPNGSPLEIVLDPSREVPKRWGTEKFPESYLIDKNGLIRFLIVSDRDWSKRSVETCIEALMSE